MIPALFTRSFSSSIRASLGSKVSLKLFSKSNCGLCDKAKNVMNKVTVNGDFKDKLSYCIVDIDDPKNKVWWEKYCFDVPVLHIENTDKTSLLKVFHRLDEKDVTEKIKTLL